MLLDVRITNFTALSPAVDQTAIDTFKAQNNERLVKIRDYILDDDNLIDAQAIADALFPSEEADVFLSHTHQDHDAVVALAVKLQGLGLNVFVDSCLWGNVYALLQEVDEIRSPIPGKPNTYYYDRSIRNAANMYMILNVALQRMIDQSELLLFLDSPAVRVQDYVEGKDYIGSPWIFSELMFAQMVRRRPREGVRLGLEGLQEQVYAADGAGPGPVARYVLPKSSHRMDTATLQQLIDDVTVTAVISALDSQDGVANKNIFLDAFYTELKPTPFERRLLGMN